MCNSNKFLFWTRKKVKGTASGVFFQWTHRLAGLGGDFWCPHSAEKAEAAEPTCAR